MHLVFICGPYRSDDPWEREQNVRRAEDAARRVALAGFMPVCPHSNTRPYFEGVQDDTFWLKGTREMMRRCDVVLMIPGWQKSTGSCGERSEALAIGMPVCESIDVLALVMAQ